MIATYPPSITTIADHLGRAPESLDWLLSTIPLGFFLAMVFNTFYSEKVNKDTLILIGLLMMSCSLWIPTFSQSLPLFFLSAILLGSGGGLVEILASAALSDKAEKHARLRVMNFSQVFFCLGAMAVPFLIGALLQQGVRWQLVFRVIAVPTAVIALVFLRKNKRKPSGLISSPANHGNSLAMLKEPALILLAFQMFSYGVSETSFVFWCCAYFEKCLGAPLWLSGITLSLFWGGVFVGRLLFSVWDSRIRRTHLLAFFYLLSLVSLFAVALLSNYYVAAFFAFAAGCGFSIVWPTILTLVGECFPGRSGASFSLCVGAGAFGALLGPAIVGRTTLLTGSFRIGIVSPSLALLLCLALLSKYRQHSP